MPKCRCIFCRHFKCILFLYQIVRSFCLVWGSRDTCGSCGRRAWTRVGVCRLNPHPEELPCVYDNANRRAVASNWIKVIRPEVGNPLRTPPSRLPSWLLPCPGNPMIGEYVYHKGYSNWGQHVTPAQLSLKSKCLLINSTVIDQKRESTAMNNQLRNLLAANTK